MGISTKNKKVTAGVGIVAATGAVIALGAGTFAAFSASADGPTTTVAAGVLEFGASQFEPADLGPLAPGESATTELTYTNGGSIAGDMTVGISEIVDIENGCNGDEPDSDSDCNASGAEGDLSGKLDLVATDITNNTEVYSGPLTDVDGSTAPVEVGPGESVTFELEFTFTEGGDSDNAAQGDSVQLTTEARLEQA